MYRFRRVAAMLLCAITALTQVLPATAAEIKYMPDVTAEMAQADYWGKLHDNADEIILTPEEIKFFDNVETKYLEH